MADFEVPAGTVVLETALDFHELDRQVKQQLPKKGEAAGKAAGKSFRRGFDAAMGDDAGRKVEKSLEGAEKGSRRARDAFEETGAGAADMGEALEGATESAGGLAAIAGTRLVKGLRGLTGWVGRTTSSFLTLSGVGVRELGEGLSQMGRELAESDSRLRSLGKAAEVTGGAIEGLGAVMISVASSITGAKIAVAGLAAAMITMAKRAEDRFRPAWNRVLTLIPEGTEGIRDLRHEVSELAADLGIEAPTALETLYQVLSAMPELVERPAEALEVLRVALKVAATGFAEGETAARAITSILNAFNLEASEAERVSDALFAAQNQGVLTFGEIATEIGKVSNLASSMNAEFEDLLGILATITPSGENVSQTMTQIRSVLRELLDPTEELNEALGGDAAGFVSDRGLLAALQRIAEVTEGDPELISEMFGRGEAIQLVVSLAQNLETLEEKTRQVQEAAGETDETLDQMTEAIEEQKDRAKELWQHDLRVWGEGYERLGLKGLKAFNDMHKALQELLDLVEDAKQAPSDIAAAYEETFHERIPRAISSTLRRLADLPPLPSRLPARGGEGPLQLPPESETGAPPGLERPEPPAPSAFAEDIQEFQAARQASAMLELMDTGDLKRYEAALRAIQLEVNDLVQAEAARLQQFGVARSELQPLLNLYDREVEKYRNLKLELTPLADATRDFFEAMRDLPDVVGPDVEGFREGAGGMLEVDPDQAQKLDELRRFTEELIDSGRDANEMWSDLQEKIDDLGLEYDDLDTSIRMNTQSLGLSELALAALGFEVEGLDEDAEGLQATLDDIEGTARGLLAVADAAGILSEELESALRGAIDLAGAIQDIDAEGLSVGAVAQGVGGAISLVSGIAGAIGGTSPEEQKRRQELIENTRAIERLRNNIDALARVFGEVSGEQVAGVEAVSAPFEGVDPEDSDAVAEGLTEAWQKLQETGITQSDVEAFAEAHGIQAEAVLMWIQNGGVIADSAENFERITEQMQALNEAAKEFQIDRMFEGFEGTVQKIEDRFALLDIDDPLQKIEAYRDAFLEFTELPEGLKQEIQSLDLSTAEGRARLEEIMLQLFEGMQQEGFDVGQLGELTPEEYREAILQIEEMLDQVGESEGEGVSRSFQIFRGVSEMQAHQLLGKADTRNVLLRFIWDELMAIRGGMGFEAPTQGPTLLPPGPALEPSERMTNPPAPRAPTAPPDPGTLSLNVDSTVNVEAGVGEDAEQIARRVSEEISRSVPRDLLLKMKEALGDDYLSEQSNLGRVRQV